MGRPASELWSEYQAMKWPILIALVLQPLYADTLIIGTHGGPDDFKIERERVVLESVKAFGQNAPVTVLFNDGDDRRFDAFDWDQEVPKSPLSYLFGDHSAPKIFRNHLLSNAKTADVETVNSSLDQLFKREPGSDNWLVVVGDSQTEVDDAPPKLTLWNAQPYNLDGFKQAANQKLGKVRTRYFFDFCGAQTLHSLAAPITFAEPAESCGFATYNVSQAYEGCKVSAARPNALEFAHDNASLWLSAMEKKAFETNKLMHNPDLDGDETITPFEAHWYALSYGVSEAIPVASSEHFLDLWGGAFVPLIPSTTQLPPNDYGELAESIALRIGFGNSAESIKEARAERAVIEDQLAETDQKMAEAAAEQATLAAEIRKEILRSWPELESPYSTRYLQTMLIDGQMVYQAATNHRSYPDMINARLTYRALQNQRDELLEKAAQIDKLFRIRHLSRQYDWLYKLGSDADIKRYESLRLCESLPLSSSDTTVSND